MAYRILTDNDLRRVLSMSDAVAAIEQAMREKAAGTLVAPPRFQVAAGRGALVFTAGAATGEAQVIGFRVYDTFPGEGTDRTQLTAVFDSESGDFKGLIIGELLGAIRTGAIGGVAIARLSRPDSRHLGVLGSGAQARTQLEAALHVRRFESVRIYSPNPAHREACAAEMSSRTGLAIKAVDSARAAVETADVIICATRSTRPVFDPQWLKPGVHINTVGPKFKDAHEIDPRVAELSAVIATDSLAQVTAYAKPFFLSSTPELERMVELSEIVAGRQEGRTSPDDITLFCSVGLAGTEVVVAAEALKRL